jgi:hypothetical protein
VAERAEGGSQRYRADGCELYAPPYVNLPTQNCYSAADHQPRAHVTVLVMAIIGVIAGFVLTP